MASILFWYWRGNDVKRKEIIIHELDLLKNRIISIQFCVDDCLYITTCDIERLFRTVLYEVDCNTIQGAILEHIYAVCCREEQYIKVSAGEFVYATNVNTALSVIDSIIEEIKEVL